MWDKKGENLTYRWLRLLKEQIDDELTIDDVGKAIDDASSTVGLPVDDPLQQPVDQEEDLIDIILKAKRNVPRCLQGNNITLGSGMGQYSALSDKVKQIQTALGFTGSDVDGKFGPKTFKAAIDFQIKNNLEPDGCVGPKTMEAMNIQPEETPEQADGEVSVVPKKMSSKGEWAKTTYEAAKNALGSKYGPSMPLLVVTFGALESAWGKRAIGNNLFGIKAPMSGGKCPGKVVSTREVVRGKKYARQSCFADYETPEKAIEGFAKFLQGKRYRDAFELFPDSPTFALAWIWANGYATGERYVPVMVSVAKQVANKTGIQEFNFEYPEELKKAMKLLINSKAMEEYALTSPEMPSGAKRYFNKIIKRSENPELSQKKRHNLIMQAAGGGRRYLGKKLIARAYMLSKGKDEVEAQRFAEKAARTGYRPVKTPMPNEQQLRQLAQSTQELENRYA